MHITPIISENMSDLFTMQSFLSPLSHLAELHLNIKVSALVEQHVNVTHILFVSRLRVFPSCDSRAQAEPGLLWSPRKAR